MLFMHRFEGCLPGWRAFVAVLLSLSSVSVFAAIDPLDATHCIRLGTDGKSQTLTNTCPQQLEVAWCHSPVSDKWAKSSECGYEGKFFRQHTVLKPRAVHRKNQFSMPLNSTIHYAACFGSYFTIKTTDAAGGFICKAKPAPKAESINLVKLLTRKIDKWAEDDKREYLERLPTLLGQCVVEKISGECGQIDAGVIRRLNALDETTRREYMDRLPGLLEACWFKKDREACRMVDQPTSQPPASTGTRG